MNQKLFSIYSMMFYFINVFSLKTYWEIELILLNYIAGFKDFMNIGTEDTSS